MRIVGKRTLEMGGTIGEFEACRYIRLSEMRAFPVQESATVRASDPSAAGIGYAHVERLTI